MFKNTDIGSFVCSPFNEISKTHFLVTAGTKDAFNTMTAGWGGYGVMWYKNIAVSVIRPTRYTKKFVDENEYFSMCFFGDDKKDAVAYCGVNSGRDVDKCKECNLTPVFDKAAPYFAEAKKVIICKKVYIDEIKPENFVDASLDDKWYPLKDYHTVYVGEIVEILINDK